MKRICMLVISDMTYDARVFREAKALVDGGLDVTVLSVGTKRGRTVQEGVKIETFPYAFSGGTILGNLATLAVMLLRATSLRADAYHAHNANTLLIGYIAALLNRAPFVFDAHELYSGYTGGLISTSGRIKHMFKISSERLLARQAKRAITTSDGYATELTRLLRIAKPTVIRNYPRWVPLRAGRLFHAAFRLPAETHVMLYQGGYYQDGSRALVEVIQSVACLPEKVVLVMMGFGVRGTEEEWLQQAATSAGVAPRVYFHTPVPQDQLLVYTMSAEIGVIPFRDTGPAMHLSSSNKLYEYLLAGVAVVGSGLPEIRAVLASHDAGAIYDPDDPKSLARVVTELLSDSAALAAMRERAREAAERKYTWEQEAERLRNLYIDLLANQG